MLYYVTLKVYPITPHNFLFAFGVKGGNEHGLLTPKISIYQYLSGKN